MSKRSPLDSSWRRGEREAEKLGSAIRDNISSSVDTPGVTNHGPSSVPRQSSKGLVANSVSSADSDVEKWREELRKKRAKMVLWKQPVTTMHYFIRELFIESKKLALG